MATPLEMEILTPLYEKISLNWQGGVVLALLLLPLLLTKFLKKIPRDLLFTIAALLSSLAGIISSAQLYQSAANQAIFTILGLWLLGKAMQQQGTFHSCLHLFSPVKKESIFSRILFFFQAVIFGAFLHHRYFPLTTLRSLSRNAEKRKGDLSIYGFPFAYLFLIGGLATAIGAPTNILFLSLYSQSMGDILSNLFAFLPFAALPILFSFLLFLILKKKFRKPFSQFIDAATCAVVPPDSLLISKAQPLTAVRKGKSISKKEPLQSGDLILFTRPPARLPFSQIALFLDSIPSSVQRWKKVLVNLFFFGAIVSTLVGVPIGTAFSLAGLILLFIRPFPLWKALREEFPLPLFLEVFSAYVYFFAIRSSGLNAWIASLISFRSPFFLLPLFFIASQLVTHFMPRPIAFASLFSIALALFADSPNQLLLISVNIAFASAIPLFGKPLLDETAISNAISGKSALWIRILLIVILFATVVIPSCLFWPN